MSTYVVGVDIGGTTIKFGLFKSNGTLVEKFAIDTDASDSGVKLLPDTAKAILDKLAERGLTVDALKGVGVGVPGPVDEAGVVLVGVNIGWEKPVAVQETLEQLLGVPVSVTNDANIAALGEMYLGAAKGAQNAIMYTLGTGVGGGVIVDGKVINGTRGAGGEIGHLTAVPEGGALCGCGKTGCLETVASATGIVRLAKDALTQSNEASVLRDVADVKAKDVFEAAQKGDKLALAVADKVCFYLGLSAANLAATTDPEQIIFGGGVSNAGDFLLDGIRKHFETFAFSGVRNTPLVIATLGNDAGIIGGAYLASR